jgi:hypothetical protein
MRKIVIKGLVLSITGFAALSAHAAEPQGELRLIEDLPTSQRVVAHEAVLQYINQHPEVAQESNLYAMDQNGILFSLDKKFVVLGHIGEPSTGGGCQFTPAVDESGNENK